MAAILLTASARPGHPAEQEPCVRAADFAAAVPSSLVYRSDYTEGSGGINVVWQQEGRENLLFRRTEAMPDGPVVWSQDIVFDRSLRPLRSSLVAGAEEEVIYEYMSRSDSVVGQRRRVGGGYEEIGVSVGNSTLLPGAFWATLPARDLLRCTTGSIRIYGAVDTAVVEYSYRVTGDTIAVVPAGRFEALAVEVRTGGRTGAMIARRAFPHIILVEQVPGSAVNILVAVSSVPSAGR